MDDKVISKKEIEVILNKYNIGKKPLSLVLGWGEVTIVRYIDGSIPDKLHSDILKEIKDNPDRLSKYLEKNKELITSVAYNKVKRRIRELKKLEDKECIYLVSKYIISKLEDITPITLQRILYYVDGFSWGLLGKSILGWSPEVGMKGPIYKKIDEYYKFNVINSENFSDYREIELENEEMIELVDIVIKSFGCYSSKILREMICLSNFWKNITNNSEMLGKVLDEEWMKKEFGDICDKNCISDYDDILSYSKKMFKKVVK